MTGRAVFLIADTGGGHRAAAMAVAQRLRRRHPDVTVDIVDPFTSDSTTRFSAGAFLSLYGILVRHFPFLWKWTFVLTNSQRAMRPVRAGLYRSFGKKFRALVESEDVCLIGSFHALTTDPLARAIREMPPGRAPRSFTLVCDPIDVHAAWITGGIDTTICPTRYAHSVARRWLGDQHDIVTVHGFPVRDEFALRNQSGDRRKARTALGLEESEPVILVTGGGEGGGRVFKQVLELLRRIPAAQVVALAGRNPRLLKRLTRLQDRYGRRLVVLDWSDDFASLLKAADVVISKAGPNTISECAVVGVPLVLTSFVPGQEDSNPRWASRVTDCVWAPSIDEMCAAVRTALASHSRRIGEPSRRAGDVTVAVSPADEIVNAIC